MARPVHARSGQLGGARLPLLLRGAPGALTARGLASCALLRPCCRPRAAPEHRQQPLLLARIRAQQEVHAVWDDAVYSANAWLIFAANVLVFCMRPACPPATPSAPYTPALERRCRTLRRPLSLARAPPCAAGPIAVAAIIMSAALLSSDPSDSSSATLISNIFQVG